MSKFTTRYGIQALITGASTGIGREFARQLAGDGMDVIITSRSLDKLEELAAELRAAHGVNVTAVRSDLSSLDGIAKLIADVDGMPVDLLINNAGAASPGAFLGCELSAQHRSLMLNVEAPIRLTHHFGRAMGLRGRGGVLFVSSTIGYGTAPWMAHYAGTKAFVTAFAEGIRGELAPLGVDVALLSPGPTRTPMVTEMKGMDLGKLPMVWMDPDAVARAGLRALPGRRSTIAGFVNQVMTFAMSRLLPRSWAAKMFGTMMGSAMTDEAKDPKLGAVVSIAA